MVNKDASRRNARGSRQHTQKMASGKRYKLPIHILGAALVLTGAGCRSHWALRHVDEPREGRPLNGRVAIVYSRNYRIDLGGLERLHPFDIHKYDRVYTHLVDDGLLAPDDVYVPAAVSDDDILRVHTPEFMESLKSSRNVAAYMEAPVVKWLPSGVVRRNVLEPFRCVTGGTLLASRRALDYGIAVNIGGGYHHAKPDAGEGFCIFADMPIAIRALQSEKRICRALVIDLDVHQGNGTIVCMANDDSTFTFSMHQRDIYPVPKEDGDLDVELESGTDDSRYLVLLTSHLDNLFAESSPDIVFYQAGCDTLAGDPLASLEMTPDGIVMRDAIVIAACVERNIPVVMTLGGGYSEDAWRVQYASLRHIIETYGTPTETEPAAVSSE